VPRAREVIAADRTPSIPSGGAVSIGMTSLLVLKTSIHGEDGVSSRLANAFTARWRAAHPGAMVIERDLSRNPVPHLTGEAFAGFSFSEPRRAQSARVRHGEEPAKEQSRMNARIPLVARVLLGLVFLFGAVTYFLNLIPPPTDMPERLKTFNAGLMASGYFLTLLKTTELACGLMLVMGFFVPLALVVLAPIALNIFLVHAILAPEGLALAVIIGVLMIYLSFLAEPYPAVIRPLFRPRP